MSTILSILSAAFFSTTATTGTAPYGIKTGFDVNKHVQHLSQKAPKLNRNVLKLALTAYKKASDKGAVKNLF